MKKKSRITPTLGFVASLVLAAQAFSATIVLTGGSCLDRAGVATADCIVAVTKDSVVATPRSAMRSIPLADETIDVTGRWIVPGFVDNHVHLGRIRADPETWIRAGITTLVDNGSSATGAELSRRYRSGPGIEPCGLIITEAGGYPAVGQKDAPALQVHGSEDAEGKTSEFIERAHPACIKIAIERGFLEDLNDQGWPALDAREVAAIVHVAHARHLSVRAHVTQRHEFDLAVDAGVDVIAHSPIEPLPDASLLRAVRRHVIIVTTVALWPDASLRSAAIGNLVRYARIGGAIAIGSDYPNWNIPGLPIAELRALRAAGLTPGELLTALTRHTVPARDRSDLVVLRSDPRISIEALREVAMVIRDGVIVVPK